MSCALKLLICLNLLLFAGCYNFDSTIIPAYSTPQARARLTTGIRLSINASSYVPMVYGVKKDPYRDTARLFLRPDGMTLLRDVLALELKAAGFELIEKGGTVQMWIDINQLFMEPEVGPQVSNYVAVTDVNLILSFENGHVYRRRFKGIGETRGLTLYGADSLYREALEKSLADFAKKAVPEIARLSEEEVSR